MAKDTKERILDAALTVFARDGYAEANIKDIADSVGIVKSALYRHFEKKETIWNAVIDMVSEYYEENLGSKDRLPEIPESTEELYDMTMKMVDFTLHDRKIILTRKIFLKEQHRDEKARKYAARCFMFGSEEMFTKIFEGMIENGIFRENNPRMLAFSYTTPITAIIHICDSNHESETVLMDKIKEFIRFFISQYGNEAASSDAVSA